MTPYDVHFAIQSNQIEVVTIFSGSSRRDDKAVVIDGYYIVRTKVFFPVECFVPNSFGYCFLFLFIEPIFKPDDTFGYY